MILSQAPFPFGVVRGNGAFSRCKVSNYNSIAVTHILFYRKFDCTCAMTQDIDTGLQVESADYGSAVGCD